MATFSDLLASFDADTGKRGKQFEHFVRWFLKNDPEWVTQVADVWLWEDYPDRWGKDCGIDLVFKHKNGETWAVQAKCYSTEYDITKHDVDKFLSESNRKGIDKRLLIATTDRIGANAKQVCDAQEKKVVRYLLSNFETADVEYPATISELHKAKPKDKPDPREHQREAIAAVAKNFQDTDRGQLIMACGTGKTFTTLWIKEQLSASSTLVLLPSLGLLSQTLHEWTLAANQPFDVLCVCSDDTVGKRGGDEAIHCVADLAFPVTSDTAEIRKFLKRDGAKVVFSTYQSSPLVAEAQADDSVQAFDLAIADEAHRCAGKAGSDFSTILDSDRIRAKKRLFTTATPRTYSTNVKKAAEGRGVEVVGMDDEAVFGKTLYSLPFGEAIKRKLLTDYRVVIIGVDNSTIAEWIANRELLKTDSGIENDAEPLAAQIGLLKAFKDYDLKRVISFHSRVNRAETFTQDIQQVIGWIGEEHRPSGSLKTDFVSGAMPTDKRRRKLAQLKALAADERGLLSNARCLSEGVDVPSLDGVAFIDPRSSQIDIIQAVGRAIRLSDDKKVGTIVLPIFINDQDNILSKIESSKYKAVWDVLNALKSHDDRLSEEFKAIRFKLGRNGGSGREVLSISNLTINIPQKVDQSFVDSFTTLVVENTTESWDEILGRLVRFKESEGHLRVPYYFEDDGYKLGQKVVNLRQQKTILRQERISILNEMGFVWNEIDEKWNDFITALSSFQEREGHLNVKSTHVESGYRLGNRVIKYRLELEKENQFYNDRIAELEKMGFIWDSSIFNWNKHFEALESFKSREGHLTVPRAHRENDLLLGKWIQRQRSNCENLTEDQLKRLTDIGFVLNPFDSSWNQALACLDSYIESHGNPDVPQRYVDGEFKLGVWCHNQRKQYSDNKLSTEKIDLLNKRSFNWNPVSTKWDQWVELLRKYRETHGDCDVPKRSLFEGEKLGAWVSNTRSSKEKLALERISQLDGLGFIWSKV